MLHIVIMAAAALGSLPGGASQSEYGVIEVPTAAAPTSLAATAVGTCSDGSMMYDVEGVVRCGSNTTTDPSDVIVRSGPCYELDGTCTASDLHHAAGIDTHQFTSVTLANCAAGDKARLAVIDKTGTALANCDCEVGTSWTCITNDNTCAAGLATCMTACAGASAQSSTTTVGVRPDDTTLDMTLSMAVDAGPACAVASNGTPGFTYFWNNIRPGVNNNYSNGDSTSRWSSMATTTLTVAGSISNPLGDTTVSDAFIASSTIDARGLISNSTDNLKLNDNVELLGQTLIGSGREFAAMTSQTLSTGGTTVSGRVITNIGASARANMTLDDAPSGRSYHWEFAVLDTDGIKIIASTSDTITLSGAAVGAVDGYICSTTVPSSAHCFGIADERWQCEISGTWSQDSDCP